jgi:phage FluMu protein Com
MTAPDLDTWRCPRCGTVLAKLRLAPGSFVELKCKRCGSFSQVEKVEQRIVAYR